MLENGQYWRYAAMATQLKDHPTLWEATNIPESKRVVTAGSADLRDSNYPGFYIALVDNGAGFHLVGQYNRQASFQQGLEEIIQPGDAQASEKLAIVAEALKEAAFINSTNPSRFRGAAEYMESLRKGYAKPRVHALTSSTPTPSRPAPGRFARLGRILRLHKQ